MRFEEAEATAAVCLEHSMWHTNRRSRPPERPLMCPEPSAPGVVLSPCLSAKDPSPQEVRS